MSEIRAHLIFLGLTVGSSEECIPQLRFMIYLIVWIYPQLQYRIDQLASFAC